MKNEDFKVYLFECFHEDSRWSFQIPAASVEDAQARVNKLPLAKYLGVLHATIPAAAPGAGLFVRLWCWWRNLSATTRN